MSLPRRVAARGETGEQGGDLLLLEEVGEQHEGRLDLRRVAFEGQVADLIDHHHAREEGANRVVHQQQVLFQAVQSGTQRMNLEQTFFHPRLQIDADGAHVAQDLRAGFLIGEEQRPLAAAAGGVDECGSDAALARARRTGHQHAAAAEHALAPEHRVKFGDARGDALGGCLMIELERGDRQHRDAALADEKRIFVGAMHRAAILHHAQAPGGNLIADALIEDNHAVRHIFLQAVARE